MSLKKLRDSMTPVQKAFVDTKKLSGRFTGPKLLKILTKVCKYDELNDDRRGCLGTSGCAAIIAVVVIMGIEFLATESLGPVSLVTFIAGAIFALISFNVTSNLGEADLDNNLRQFTFPLLAILSEETKPGSRIKIDIDCHDPYSEAYLYKETMKKSTYGRDIYYYKYPYFDIHLSLIDDSTLSLQNIDFLRRIEIEKISTSGKFKRKTKYKKATLVKATAVFPKEHYTPTDHQKEGYSLQTTDSSYIVRTKLKYKGLDKDDRIPLNQYLKDLKELYQFVTKVS